MGKKEVQRRDFLKYGALGLTGGAALAATGVLNAKEAAAQAAGDSLLQKVLDRGKLICGTGSTNAPWHFENEKGELDGMDIAMAKILARGLFDDENAVEFIKQAPDARIPNIVTGKVDIVIQFMTINPHRAQLVAFSRPYYIEGVALLTSVKGKYKTYQELLDGGSSVTASVLQNVDAELLVHTALPKAKPMLLDTQANVVQALESGRSHTAIIDLSTVRWMVARNPDRYFDSGHAYWTQLYGAAVKHGDPDWLKYVDTVFDVAMFGHLSKQYAEPCEKYFGQKPPEPKPGFPAM